MPRQRIVSTACKCVYSDSIYSLQVNDSSGRGVKLVNDFLHLSLREENLQNRVYVVENNLNP